MRSYILLLAVSVMTLCFAVPNVAFCDIVVNGGFETGNLTGWAQSGETDYIGVAGAGAHSGAYALYAGPTLENGYLSQTLPTVAGGHYELSFWLRNDNSDPPNNAFAVYWGGNLLGGFVDSPGFDYSGAVVTDLEAAGSSTTLEFMFYNPPAFWYLDDVSVTQVPEPASVALLGLAVGALALRFRRR